MVNDMPTRNDSPLHHAAADDEQCVISPASPHTVTRRTLLKRAALAGVAVGSASTIGGLSSGIAFAEKAKTINVQARKTLQLWHVLSPVTAKAGYIALEQVATQFEKQSGVHVALNFVQFTEAGAFQEKVNAAAASNNPPDIVMLSGSINYAYTGAARILDPYVASSSLVKQKDFIPGQWARNVWQGHVYGIPIGADANALFWWNRDVFKQNGLNPDQPPTTWKELADLTERLFKRDKRGRVDTIGFVPTYGQAWPMVFYYLQGPTTLLSAGQPPKVLFSDAYGVRGLQYQAQLTDLNGGAKLMNGFSQGFQSGAQDPFITGKLAMMCNGNWQQGYYQQYAPRLNYGVATMPLPPGGTHCTTSGGFAWSIPQKAHNPDDAWRFVEFASQPEEMVRIVKGWPTLPTRLALLTDKRFTSDPVGKVASAALRNARGWGEGPWGSVLWTQYSLNARDNTIYHKMTAQQALSQAAKIVQQTINQDY